MKNEKIGINDLKVVMIDSANILAIGSCKHKGEWKKIKISVDLLKNTLKILTTMEIKDVWIYIGNEEFPLCIGSEIKKDIFSGVIIAPRIVED